MRAVIIYRDNTDEARTALSYQQDYKRLTGRDLERVNPDDREGSFFCQTYDITRHPSVLVLDYRGAVLASWFGEPLPVVSEVSFYLSL